MILILSEFQSVYFANFVSFGFLRVTEFMSFMMVVIS